MHIVASPLASAINENPPEKKNVENLKSLALTAVALTALQSIPLAGSLFSFATKPLITFCALSSLIIAPNLNDEHVAEMFEDIVKVGTIAREMFAKTVVYDKIQKSGIAQKIFESINAYSQIVDGLAGTLEAHRDDQTLAAQKINLNALEFLMISTVCLNILRNIPFIGGLSSFLTTPVTHGLYGTAVVVAFNLRSDEVAEQFKQLPRISLKSHVYAVNNLVQEQVTKFKQE